ncbi:MAG TPA: CPBP family intramembrane glutamic endopeptidase [Candidatus Eisenbacteria bacterium]|nr:CPBP family intramembrane glutamic endopeptidase [Candidatus Eisenbacteria bacterium]
MAPRDIPAAFWLLLVLVAIPWGGIENHRRMRAGALTSERADRALNRPRPSLYALSVWGTAQLLVVAVLLDWIDHWQTVRKAIAFPRHGLWWILGCVAAHQVISFVAMFLRRVRRIPLEAGTARILPRSAGELAAFAPLALAAGVYEEFMYRGFVPDHLARWGLPLWLAVAIATLSFGLSHGYKSLVGMLRSALIGLVLAVPVLVTGTLLPSMIAHTIMDLIAGANTLPLARRLGVAIPAA